MLVPRSDRIVPASSCRVRTLGTDERPAGNGEAVATDRTGAVPLDDGLIPPADVGGERQTGTRRTTLFDFLTGG